MLSLSVGVCVLECPLLYEIKIKTKINKRIIISDHQTRTQHAKECNPNTQQDTQDNLEQLAVVIVYVILLPIQK